jgi:hypothetical protein
MKRYDMDCDCPDCHYCGMFMDECNDGDYVKYEDAKVLIDALKEILEVRGHAGDDWSIKEIAEQTLKRVGEK